MGAVAPVPLAKEGRMSTASQSGREAWKIVAVGGRLPKGWRASLHSFVKTLPPEVLAVIAEQWLADDLTSRDRSATLREERAVIDAPPAPVVRELWQTPPRETDQAKTLRSRVGEIVAQTASALHSEWEPSFLRQIIRMPDGREVTWGAATVADHETRLQMFTVNAVANLEGAARHERAIRDIRTAGIRCLSDLNAVVAA